ncbi:MAG: DUF447 domain-containing protein [Promethearchaeati archaeon SRVP18_Atabeyarchaeia-1]
MSRRHPSNKAILERLGATNDFVFEVIVSTCAIDGTPNAAPMGIRFVGAGVGGEETKILVKPFKSTTTYRNLSAQREAVVNVSSNPAAFFATAFKGQVERESEVKIDFSAASSVKPPRVKGCDAYIELMVEDVKEGSLLEDERCEVLCRVKSAQLQNPDARLYCRAPYILIEAIIHATRVNALRSQGLMKEAGELTELVHRYRNLVHRVAPNSEYENIAAELEAIIHTKKEETGVRIRGSEGDE